MPSLNDDDEKKSITACAAAEEGCGCSAVAGLSTCSADALPSPIGAESKAAAALGGKPGLRPSVGEAFTEVGGLSVAKGFRSAAFCGTIAGAGGVTAGAGDGLGDDEAKKSARSLS